METLTCPKCQGSMRTYERSNITVDQCTECRGIFLDRGELERLVDAEVAFNATAPAVPLAQQQPRYDDRRPDDRRYEDKRYEEKRYEEKRYDKDRRYDERGGYDKYGNQQHPRKKKKSFFEELFD
ncbi:zf-TFIIB domain-containing protein [Kribbella sp. NPDC006257]|uniref:TFIIB-type zinc ribbon-containing protein n=1 Tax=Kribbella sp. NPDC006257 TaxID=3156738 RepID=UPI0033BF556A